MVLDIVAQSARALDTAHQAGIVHRDIKPGNLLIMADGTTKITDFGIAKANSLQAMNLTATGIVMGTALYVSPEQATGSPLTGSSDVYSLGVVAYECLSGQPPFMADQPLAIAIMHKHDPVPPLPPDVPRPVADLVYAMLAKAPDGRPETAQHVADRAEVIREGRRRSGYAGPITADLPVVPNFPPADGNDFYNNGNDFYNGDPGWSPDSRPRRRALLLAGAGLAACGIIAAIVILLTSSTTPPATLTQKIPNATSPGQSARAAASPTTASLLPSTVGGYATATNLVTASKAPTAPRSASPTTSARKSPTPTHTSPSTSTSSSAPATSSSPASTGPATSSPPVTSPPSSPTSSPPTTPTTGAAATPPAGIAGG